ncbi:MAG: site-2 protease family protein [Lachnospiraceae bacterium]|nr:site-2 protease family protein [Lachnospiraceae bacterium]
MNIVLIIIIFGIIVFFHELGHFIFAKLNNISVIEFSIGMGPAIFSFKKKETKYSLRLLPLGGYCMMMGEEEESDDENAFGNKSVWSRMSVILAGPVFNFILAFIFSIVLIHFTGCDPSILTYVEEGSPAAEAGIEVGDRIVSIQAEGEKKAENIYNYRELLLYRQLHASDVPVTMEMRTPDGNEYTTTVVPRANEDGAYMLGVAGGYRRSDNFGMDCKYGVLELRYWVKATVSSLKMLVMGQVKSTDVMGPVGVGNAFGEIIDEVKQESSSSKEAVINIVLNMINWCILLSVNLGIMNLLPIPALDGGRFLFLLIEAVRRKRISPEKEANVNLIGFILLIILMIVVFANDIKNVFF